MFFFFYYQQVKSTIFSNWVYLSDAEGHILYTDSEYLRKASSKKRKKKKVNLTASLDDETNYNLKVKINLMKSQISESERAYILEGFRHNACRRDGRGILDHRNYKLELGVVPHGFGSS